MGRCVFFSAEEIWQLSQGVGVEITGGGGNRKVINRNNLRSNVTKGTRSNFPFPVASSVLVFFSTDEGNKGFPE